MSRIVAPRAIGQAGTAVPARPGSQFADRRRRQLLELVDGLEHLPTSAVVPIRVLRLKQSGTAGAADLAKVLSADAGLCAKIISLVNSAAFAPAHPVTRLPLAVAMIGERNLLSLVFGLSLSGLFHRLALRPEERDSLFHASLLKACTAQAVAKLTAPGREEDAFLFGLFQDVGLPVVLAADRALTAEVGDLFDVQDPVARLAREQQIYATDHATPGRGGRRWRAPSARAWPRRWTSPHPSRTG
jgi:HD-like signal output (HDOD) protein